MEVEVKNGERAVVVRGLAARSYEEALVDALARAQEGLDLLSARGVVSVAIGDIGAEHFAWWDDAGASVLRFWGSGRLTITVGRVRVVVTDRDGNVRPEPGPPTTWHESMRYFRQAQVTRNLFDAFRNLYLALESVLSAICPMRIKPSGKPDESEGEWFRRALDSAGGRVDLGRFTTSLAATPAVALFDEIYKTVRTSVFHAKSGRPVLLPHDAVARGPVLDVLERLARFYLELLGDVTGVRFGSGGVFAAAFRMMAGGVAMDLLHLTDGESPIDASETEFRVRAGSSVLSVPLTAVPDLNETWFLAHLALTPMADLAGQLPYLSKLVTATQDGKPGIAFTLEGRLDPVGFDRFEAVVGPRGENARMPRTRYTT